MENLKKFIQEEVQKLHRINVLEEQRQQIEKRLKLLGENEEVEDEIIPDTDKDWEPDFYNDCFIADKPRGGYDVSCSGEFLGNFEEMDLALQKVEGWMKKNSYFPTIWFVSDHGNYWPIDSKGNELKETKDVKAMYRKAGMTPPDGKGIHTKKFHKCVTSVGDKGGKNPYAICMSSLGKEKAVKASHRTDETIGIEYEQMNEGDSTNPELKAHAIDFIKTVLKLGRKDNLFDIYMKEHNIRPDLLSEFIDTVAEEIDKHWWEGVNEGAVLDTKREISKAGIMPKKGVDLRFNMHDEPYILKTMDTPEVNDWIAKVKNAIPNIIVTTFKNKSK